MEKKLAISMRTINILGRILLLIFINNFSNSSDILLPTLFADDTTLSISNANYKEWKLWILNHELDLLNNWTILNRNDSHLK